MISNELRSDVYAYLSDERLNVDLIFDWDEERGMLINCRLRPWKNSDHDGKMILAAGLTADEALLWAIRGALNGRWIPLVWQRRAREVGIEKTITPTLVPQRSTRSATLAKELFSETDSYDDTYHGQNGAQEGSQSVPRTKKLVQKELPGIS